MSSDIELEKKYNKCINYLATNVEQTILQLQKNKVSNGIINIDLKLSQCELFFNNGSVSIQKNNINFKLNPVKYIKNVFVKYNITQLGTDKLIIDEKPVHDSISIRDKYNY
jgi:hypothetical protein